MSHVSFENNMCFSILFQVFVRLGMEFDDIKDRNNASKKLFVYVSIVQSSQLVAYFEKYNVK